MRMTGTWLALTRRFWAFFHSALAPTVELGSAWPPVGIEAVDPLMIPLLNTALLMSSGATVTYAHHSFFTGDRASSINGMALTLALAVVFTMLQAYEYSAGSFTIADGAFGSCHRQPSPPLHAVTPSTLVTSQEA